MWTPRDGKPEIRTRNSPTSSCPAKIEAGQEWPQLSSEKVEIHRKITYKRTGACFLKNHKKRDQRRI